MSEPERNPPALAVWLLQRLTTVEMREAFLGDLIEKFNRGRSSHWFWLEVLTYLSLKVGVSLRAHRGEITFAVIGTVLQEVWWSTRWWRTVWRSNTIQALYGWGVGWSSPLSGVYDLTFHALTQLTILLPFAAILLAAKGTLNSASLSRTILISFAILNAGEWIFLPFSPKLFYVSNCIPFFCALLVSTWRSSVTPLGDRPPSPTP